MKEVEVQYEYLWGVFNIYCVGNLFLPAVISKQNVICATSNNNLLMRERKEGPCSAL